MVLSKIVIYLILFLLEICRIKVFGDVLAKGIVFLDCKNSDLTKSQKLLFFKGVNELVHGFCQQL